MTDAEFIPGLELCEGFFHEHVAPLMRQGFLDLPFSAALIGPGSEVLGFDTPMSTDHHWGPRAMLFLLPEDLAAHGDAVRTFFSRRLPSSFRGYSTHFTAPDPRDHGVQLLASHTDGPINHRVELFTIDGFFQSFLGVSAVAALTSWDWLALPAQKLRSVVAGQVFHDGLGLNAARERLAWYPRDVSLYVLGCLWHRIGQEEHLMGRAGALGDEIGSSLIAARLVRDIMRIAFHLEQQYPPYPKWFGLAFARLDCAGQLRPHLEATLGAQHWREREAALAQAYEELLQIQNAADIRCEVRRVSPFWGRPYLVIHGDRIAADVFSDITNPQLAQLARNRPIGHIDAMSDNTDVLEDATILPLLRELYWQDDG